MLRVGGGKCESHDLQTKGDGNAPEIDMRVLVMGRGWLRRIIGECVLRHGPHLAEWSPLRTDGP